MTRRLFSAAAMLLLAGMPALVQAGGSGEVRLRTQLTGARIDRLTPSGQADFRARSGRADLKVEVEDVNVPVGTVLDVYVDNAKVGTITVAAVTLGGELDLNTQDGAVVPKEAKGSVVVVKNGEQGIVAGVF